MMDFSGKQFDGIRKALEYIFAYPEREAYKYFITDKRKWYHFEICKNCGHTHGHHFGNDECNRTGDTCFEIDPEKSKRFFIFARLLL